MTITVNTPEADELGEAVAALRGWQHADAPLQLHPGDLGWFWRSGAEATAAVRTWSRDGQILAVGLLDGADLLRLTVAPDLHRNEELTQRLVADIGDPELGVLGPGRVAVETPTGTLVHDLLGEIGWKIDEPWTPLRRDLTAPVPDPGLRIEVVGPEQAAVWTAVLRAAFGGVPLTPQTADRRWRAMTDGDPYADARSLVGYDDQDNAVAAVTVWSAGPGLPGLLEPMGAHPEHRGHGHGTAITLAAAAALKDMGSCSADVCTPSANVGGVATYRAAGFQVLPERRDRYREA